MKTKEEEQVTVVLRLPVSMRDWLRAQAAAEERSVNWTAKQLFGREMAKEKQAA